MIEHTLSLNHRFCSSAVEEQAEKGITNDDSYVSNVTESERET